MPTCRFMEWRQAPDERHQVYRMLSNTGRGYDGWYANVSGAFGEGDVLSYGDIVLDALRKYKTY